MKSFKFALLSIGFYLLFPLLIQSHNLISDGNSDLAAVGSKKHDDKNKRSFLLRDEGLSQLSYINLADPKSNWYQSVPKGRDLQLIGDGRVLIGTETGYEERLISNGEKIFELTSFPGTITARRLRNGETLLAGINWFGTEGIVLAITNKDGQVTQKINFPEYRYVRLIRQTTKGTFLVTANDVVFEGDSNGDILWETKVTGREDPHAWQALRLKNGTTVLSSGYGGGIHIFNKKGDLIKLINGPGRVNPYFYSGLQILRNGDMVVTNWQGHGPGHGTSGEQLLEYSPDGKLVWSWKQDPTHFSSLQGVIVLDGLDTNYLHVEDENGVLAPVK